MRAIVNTGPGKLEWLDVPVPVPASGCVRVRTDAVGICATDLLMIAGWQRTGYPSIPGHEWSGTIDLVGENVSGDLVGRKCVAENVLSDGGEVGFEHPGGYGQFLVTEADRIHVLPPDFPSPEAALIEPLAVCVRALRRLRPIGSGPVLILGDGPIGLIIVMLLAQRGIAPIAVAGGRPPRLDLAASLGAVRTVNYHEADDDLLGFEPHSFGVVVEATGSARAADSAIRLAAQGGRVLVLGDYGDGLAGFRWLDLLHNEVEAIGSNASAEAWPEAVDLAREGRLPLARLITHRLPAHGFPDAMELTARRTTGAVKVVLDWALADVDTQSAIGYTLAPSS